MRELASGAIAAILLVGGAYACQVAMTETEQTTTTCEPIDGDTLRCDGDLRLRLNGIDAPELPTEEAIEATWQLRDLLEHTNGAVTYAAHKQDAYGRTVAQVYVTIDNEPVDLSCYQLVTGHARYVSEWDEQQITKECAS